MTRLITKAALLSACGMLVAVAAMAGVPSPANCTKPAFIRLVGSAASVPDSAAGKFTVIVRDLANNTITASNVVVDFSGCTADLKIANTQLNANYTLNCTNHTVAAFTNSSGQVDFTILGNSFLAPHTGIGCAKIYADGVLINSPTVAAFDLDGANGVTSNDLSVWLSDLGTHIYYGRSDYDANGAVGSNDLSVWLTELGTHKSAVTLATCP